MTQGVFVNGSRPKYKKDLKAAIESNPSSVSLEATSIFGNEYGGPIVNMPEGSVTIVGPCPHTRRNWYGTITRRGDKFSVS